MAMASGAQTERRGIPRLVRLPRGGEDAPAAFVSSCCRLIQRARLADARMSASWYIKEHAICAFYP
jgi:hypothetical protein